MSPRRDSTAPLLTKLVKGLVPLCLRLTFGAGSRPRFRGGPGGGSTNQLFGPLYLLAEEEGCKVLSPSRLPLSLRTRRRAISQEDAWDAPGLEKGKSPRQCIEECGVLVLVGGIRLVDKTVSFFLAVTTKPNLRSMLRRNQSGASLSFTEYSKRGLRRPATITGGSPRAKEE